MATRDDWEEHWKRYAAAASRNPAQRMRHAAVAARLRRGLDEAKACILDLGSGQGDLVELLRRTLPKAQFLGVELSASGVALSRRKVPDAVFLSADLFHPSEDLRGYAGWATDAVCSEVLEHVDSPGAFLEAARPWLADGARLIVTVPGGPISAFDREIGHRRHFTRASIAEALEEAGFEVERVDRAGFPFFNLYRLVVLARGRRLAADVAAENTGFSSRLAAAVMAIFRGLFHLNLPDSPFGWQMIAIARKVERVLPEA